MKNKHTGNLVAAALISLVAGCGGGSSPSGAGASETVVGYAVDDAVIGADVKVYAGTATSPVHVTRTGALGRFGLPQLPAGVYRIVITGGVEDADGLPETTADQRPFAGSLSSMLDAGAAITAPVLVNAVTTGLELFAGGDYAKYQASLKALPPELASLNVMAAGDAPGTAVAKLATIQRAVGFDLLVSSLSASGTVGAAGSSVSAANIASVVAAGQASGAIAAIADLNLRLCLAGALEKDVGNISLADLRGIESLNCVSQGIRSLAGIGVLDKLAYAHFEDNDVSDLAPLSANPGLSFLNIRNNRVGTLKGIASASAQSVAMMVSDNCITDARELNDSARFTFTGYDYKSKKQYSSCDKSDADVLALVVRARLSGDHVLVYRTTFNPTLACRINWGDGQSESAFCDGKTYYAPHKYANANAMTVSFSVNGVVKRTAPVQQTAVDQALAEGIGEIESYTTQDCTDVVNCTPQTTYGLHITRGGNGSFNETSWSIQNGVLLRNIGGSGVYLSATGWVPGTNTGTYTNRADGSFTLSALNFGPLGAVVRLRIEELAGKPLSTYVNGVAGNYPPGARAYWLSGTNNSDRYRLQESVVGSTEASLAAFVGNRQTPSAGAQTSGVVFQFGSAYTFDGPLVAAGSTGVATAWPSNSAGATPYAVKAQYEHRSVSGQSILVFTSLPTAAIGSQASGYYASGQRPLLSMRDGLVWRGNFQSAGAFADTTPSFNRTALDAMLAALSLPDTAAALSSTATTAGGSGATSGSASAVGNLAIVGGESYPLRVDLFVNAAGKITGGAYDYHKAADTGLPCTFSPANAGVCFGVSNTWGAFSFAGVVGVGGIAGTVSLVSPAGTGGLELSGTISGSNWAGIAKIQPPGGGTAANGNFIVSVNFIRS